MKNNSNFQVIDLFAGIGGFSKGLEGENFETAAFCEYDESAQKVLKKHWKIPVFKDVTTMNAHIDGDRVSFIDSHNKVSVENSNLVITGGFPCQDVSRGGAQRGVVESERSSLFKEIVRLASTARPRFILMENVEALLSNGMAVVVREFAKIGYDCEWSVHYARDFGLPHQRARVYILCYPQGKGKEYLNKSIYEELGVNNEVKEELYKIPRVSPAGDDKSENLRKQRVKQCGNSIIPAIAGLWGKAMQNGGKEYDPERYQRVCNVFDLEYPEKEKLPNCAVCINGKVYKREEITKLKRDTSCSLFPTPVASDCMLILGKNDKYRLTKNGRVRVVRKSGKDASLNLARFVRFYPVGGLTAKELPNPSHDLLDPTFTEQLMGYPKDWTKLEI